MEFIGKWKVLKTMYPTSDGIKHLTKEELIALGEEDLQMFDSVIEFAADGSVNTLIPVPADQIEAAKADGLEIDENGYACVEKTEWKTEDGKAFVSMDGDFVPLELTQDGLLKYAMGMMLLEKFA